MRDSSWQGGVTFGTSAAFRRHVGPLPSGRKVVQTFSCVGNDVYARRSPVTNHNDKHGTTCTRRAAAHELFARKLVYRVIMPTSFALRGDKARRGNPHGETVAGSSACAFSSLHLDYLSLNVTKIRPFPLMSQRKEIVLFDVECSSLVSQNYPVAISLFLDSLTPSCSKA